VTVHPLSRRIQRRRGVVRLKVVSADGMVVLVEYVGSIGGVLWYVHHAIPSQAERSRTLNGEKVDAFTIGQMVKRRVR
jgi:hypothetical protein